MRVAQRIVRQRTALAEAAALNRWRARVPAQERQCAQNNDYAGAAAARHRLPPAALPLLPRIVRAAARLARIVAVNREVHAERYNPLIAAAAARVLARPHVQGAPWRAYY